MRTTKKGIQLTDDRAQQMLSCPFHPAAHVDWETTSGSMRAGRIFLKRGFEAVRLVQQVGGRCFESELDLVGPRLVLGFVSRGEIQLFLNGGGSRLLQPGSCFRFSTERIKLAAKAQAEEVQINLFLCSQEMVGLVAQIEDDASHSELERFAKTGESVPIRRFDMAPELQSLATLIADSRSNHLKDRLQLEANAMSWVSEVLMQQALPRSVDQSSTLNANDRDAIETIVRQLKRDPGREYSLQELSLIGGINENKLKYSFRKLYGQTTFGYLRQLRMDYASELLQADRMSVIQVANEVGYTNASHFARAFKERHGLLPKAYQCIHRSTALVR